MFGDEFTKNGNNAEGKENDADAREHGWTVEEDEHERVDQQGQWCVEDLTASDEGHVDAEHVIGQVICEFAGVDVVQGTNIHGFHFLVDEGEYGNCVQAGGVEAAVVAVVIENGAREKGERDHSAEDNDLPSSWS